MRDHEFQKEVEAMSTVAHFGGRGASPSAGGHPMVRNTPSLTHLLLQRKTSSVFAERCYYYYFAGRRVRSWRRRVLNRYVCLDYGT